MPLGTIHAPIDSSTHSHTVYYCICPALFTGCVDVYSESKHSSSQTGHHIEIVSKMLKAADKYRQFTECVEIYVHVIYILIPTKTLRSNAIIYMTQFCAKRFLGEMTDSIAMLKYSCEKYFRNITTFQHVMAKISK